MTSDRGAASRTRVLDALRRTALPEVALPEVALPEPAREPAAAAPADAFAGFREALRAADGEAVRCEGEGGLARALAGHGPLRAARRVVAAGVALAGAEPLDLARADVHALADVDVAVVRGAFGVVENGAVALAERGRALRAAALLCEHLVLVVAEADLVATLDDAYARLDADEGEDGAACWRGLVAGPSKTADIEQALVTGAHGPRSLLVVVVR